jgi:DNA-directed RNA polymerase specialized sigma54-like protein
MRIKSICLVCRGSGKKTVNEQEHPCLGCKGYGFIFVKSVEEKQDSDQQELPSHSRCRRALHIRAKTSGLTEKIIQAVEEHQAAYLQSLNIMDLRPMVLRDIADIAGCDTVTVHHHLRGKQICGIDVKELFSESVSGVSTKVIMAMLKNMMQTPASDVEYTKMLAQRGITIARRTVAKYRKKMKT